MGFDGLPLTIAWELTLACNLRCRHCASAAGVIRSDELTLQECLSVCDQLPDLLVRECDFTGGEPLMRADWPIIAARLVQFGITTQIITNAVALDADAVRQMVDVGISGVGFSVDGLGPTHDSIRMRPGLFDRIVKGIHMVEAAELPATVITTATALNLDELPELLRALHGAGVRRWQIQPIFPVGRGKTHAELHLTNEAYLRLGSIARQLASDGKSLGVEVGVADSCGYFTELDTREIPWRGCPAGRVSLGIASNGDIKGCLSLPDELVEGNIRERTLWDIWFDSTSFRYNREVGVAGPNCRGCEEFEVCGGGCAAMSHGCTGRFHDNPYCFKGIRQRLAVPA